MTIEYHPPYLATIIKDSFATRRLKNREGSVAAKDESGRVLGWEVGGDLLDILKEAIDYQANNPAHNLLVVMDTCGQPTSARQVLMKTTQNAGS